jgi:hypothetical protein
MRLASKMLLQLAAQYIGQLTDIECGVYDGRPSRSAPGSSLTVC